MNERPLSPHLTVWKWGPAMLVSILHRITGDGLAIVGLGVLLWWLCSLASGEVAYAEFIALADTWYGYVVLVGISWAFFNHLISGLRHLMLDTGVGYEVETNKRWSVGSIVAGIVLTAGFWAVQVLI